MYGKEFYNAKNYTKLQRTITVGQSDIEVDLSSYKSTASGIILQSLTSGAALKYKLFSSSKPALTLPASSSVPILIADKLYFSNDDAVSVTVDIIIVLQDNA